MITGGSSGIGKACAKQLAALGCSVILIARDGKKLKQAEKEIRDVAAFGAKIDHFAIDVTNFSHLKKTISRTQDLYGSVDILINSAGIARPGYFEKLPLGLYHKLMETNYLGTVYAVKAVLPGMMERKSGHIVNVGSVAGLIGIYGYSAYSPTKFAITGFSESIRMELKVHGIRVSLLCPPDTDTPQLTSENRHKPMETRAVAGNAGVMSADDVARYTLCSMTRGKFMILPNFESRAIYAAVRFIPGIARSIMDRMIRKSRK